MRGLRGFAAVFDNAPATDCEVKKLQSWADKVVHATSAIQVEADISYECGCSTPCSRTFIASYASLKECTSSVLRLRAQRTEGTASNESTWLFQLLYNSRLRSDSGLIVAYCVDGVRVCEEYFAVVLGFVYPNRRIQKYVKLIQVVRVCSRTGCVLAFVITSVFAFVCLYVRMCVHAQGMCLRLCLRLCLRQCLHLFVCVLQDGHSELPTRRICPKSKPTIRSERARSWIREYCTTHADFAPVGSTTLYIPPRKPHEVWSKYVEQVEWDEHVHHLGERQFCRVFKQMLGETIVCPNTNREMHVKIKTQRARGFKICKDCEDYRMLLWNCKNREQKTVYLQGLKTHWDEHSDGRDVYNDHKNYCQSSNGAAVSVVIDAADQSKFGVFRTSHRGMQDQYRKVKQKITGALVHGLGYFIFR